MPFGPIYPGLHHRHQRHLLAKFQRGEIMSKTAKPRSRKPLRASGSYEKWLAKAVHDFNRSERYKEIQETNQIEQQELQLVREMRQWL